MGRELQGAIAEDALAKVRRGRGGDTHERG
jgi:hypothetical protein